MDYKAQLEPVPYSDLSRAAERMDGLNGADDITTVAIAMCELFQGDTNKSAAVMLRMEALRQLQDHPEMDRWQKGNGELPEPLLKAAADAPFKGKFSASFDPDIFFARAEELSKG